MSADLKDFRGKITAETDCVLEAQSRVTGVDRSEIVRNLLHKWALERIEEARLLHQQLQAQGVGGIVEGIAGNRGESQGMRRKTGE